MNQDSHHLTGAKKTPPVKIWKNLFISCGVIIIIIIIAYLLIFHLPAREIQKANPLILVPADTQLCLYIDLTELSELSNRELKEIFSRWKNTDLFRMAKKKVRKTMDLDLDNDIISWIGPRFCISGSQDTARAETHNLLIIATVRDRKNLDEALERIEQQFNDKYSATYTQNMNKGFKTYLPDKPECPSFCLYKNFFLISEDIESINRAIDTAQNSKDTIINSPDYQKICSQLPKGNLASLYCDLRTLNNLDNPAHLIEYIGIAAAEKEEGILLEGIVLFDSAFKLPADNSERFESPAIIAGDTTFFCIANSAYLKACKNLMSEKNKTPGEKDINDDPIVNLATSLTEHTKGEIAIIFDYSAIFKEIFKKRKEKSGSPTDMPLVFAVKLDDISEIETIITTLLPQGGSNSTFTDYREHRIYCKDDTAYTKIDDFCFISVNGDRETLEKLIDTKTGNISPVTEEHDYKIVSQDKTGKDLMALHLSLSDMGLLTKIYAATNPKARNALQILEAYGNIWVKIEMDNSYVRLKAFLRDK